MKKAKIRYEGILYAIDTDAMTVALTKVRSFGTENRCPDRPIGPRDEIFGKSYYSNISSFSDNFNRRYRRKL